MSRTLYALFRETVARSAERPCLTFATKRGGPFETWSYAETLRRVDEASAGFVRMGIGRGDRIALLAHENRAEWAVADIAAQRIGAITVAIYGSLPAAQTLFYLQDSGAACAVVADSKQAAKIAAGRADLPALKWIVIMGAGRGDGTDMTFDDLLASGRDSPDWESKAAALEAAVSADDTATLIYTSGTTGKPKGAMLSHANLAATPDAVVAHRIADIRDTDVFLSFLPLSHITERVGGYWLPLRCGAQIVFSQGVATVAAELTKTVRPTAMLCVPRLLETVEEKARAAIAKQGGFKGRLARAALAIAERRALASGSGRPAPLLTLAWLAANRLVYPRLREQTTGGRIRYIVSGGAPLKRSTASFFFGIGIDILEGYGLSESGIIAINRPGRQQVGTVGPLLPDVEARIEADGELLARGPGRMAGYWKRSDETAAAIDSEGWLHTGDIASISADGIVTITGRKKDIIVLGNGKKVSPQPIEEDLQKSSYIHDAVLLGDGESTVRVVVVPHFENVRRFLEDAGEIAPAADSDVAAVPAVVKLVKSEVERVSQGLADFERIRQVTLAHAEFSIEGGELTPTMKVKRGVIAERFRQ